jgi:hypothetical protein
MGLAHDLLVKAPLEFPDKNLSVCFDSGLVHAPILLLDELRRQRQRHGCRVGQSRKPGKGGLDLPVHYLFVHCHPIFQTVRI